MGRDTIDLCHMHHLMRGLGRGQHNGLLGLQQETASAHPGAGKLGTGVDLHCPGAHHAQRGHHHLPAQLPLQRQSTFKGSFKPGLLNVQVFLQDLLSMNACRLLIWLAAVQEGAMQAWLWWG